MRIAALGTLVLCTANAAHAADRFPKCFDKAYEGHCVAAEVNGQKTVRLSKKTKKMLEARGSLNYGNCDIRYEVPAPVDGALDLRFAWLPEAVSHFGTDTQSLVHVYPLDGQDLQTRPEISSSSSVTASGSAVLTKADVIQGDRLPRGKYVITARVDGSRRGWDCHGFFVDVAE